jgi:hypothetical protein
VFPDPGAGGDPKHPRAGGHGEPAGRAVLRHGGADPLRGLPDRGLSEAGGQLLDHPVEPVATGETGQVGIDLLHPVEEPPGPLGVRAPAVGEVLLGLHWVGHPPDSVATLDQGRHPPGDVGHDLVQVPAPTVGPGRQGGDNDGGRPLLGIGLEVDVAVAFEGLHRPLQGGLHLPLGHLRHVPVLRLGQGLPELDELLLHAPVEPVGVADGVGVLPVAQAPVGEQDRVGHTLRVGDGGQDVHVESVAWVDQGPAAVALLQRRGRGAARGRLLVVGQPGTHVLFQLRLGDGLLDQVPAADQVQVVLVAVVDWADDGPQAKRPLHVDLATGVAPALVPAAQPVPDRLVLVDRL